MREAVAWTVFYLALPFVLMLLLAAFAVPTALTQRVLLFGIVGALVLRAVFIAVGAAVISAGSWAFLLFGAVLLLTAGKVMRDAISGHEQAVDIVRQAGRRAPTPMALVVVAVGMTDIVFAADSVPAVDGVTDDPYIVFATNAFALLGLRALYFVLHNALSRLRHLNHGLAIILAFIGVKLILHWAHTVWPQVPDVPTPLRWPSSWAFRSRLPPRACGANRREVTPEPETVPTR
ncbi:hypothetical protein Aau02nite_21080 [Amorphoplanes auranticolor]|uniref:TerC family integral membrane protein n=1 Tax=Actinoplanes auranticolor TaxID=47988 RepID=A0A919VQV3_9ACTN|nr:hypothetical protein Aau02nite_21080 [Actinoplanes auranticolor]